MDVRIEAGWKSVLKEEFAKPYFREMTGFLKTEKAAGKVVYPPGSRIFRAFELTPFENTRVVILGQDPYHGPGQANGLCFSVSKGVPPPPSLQNIFKEIRSDLGMNIRGDSGDLSPWARQGVLLLNASLTVRAEEPMSHARIGWAPFTDAVIRELSKRRNGLVFMLWGRFAQEKASVVDGHAHLLLKAAHPSPLSADRGFFGCKHFSKANAWLVSKGSDPIDWQVDSSQTEMQDP
jgi:uracil-DNA glycosylase